MGGSKQYLESGGFSSRTYRTIGTTPNGIKIVMRSDGDHGTPLYANTPYTIYAASGKKSNGKPIQVSVYQGRDGRQKIKDIDWGHSHKNALDGWMWKKGEIHVQEYNGMVRNSEARKPSAKEKRIAMMARSGKRSPANKSQALILDK